MCVHALKGKRLELSIPNLIREYPMAKPGHVLTLRSVGLRLKSHGYQMRAGVGVQVDMTASS